MTSIHATRESGDEQPLEASATRRLRTVDQGSAHSAYTATKTVSTTAVAEAFATDAQGLEFNVPVAETQLVRVAMGETEQDAISNADFAMPFHPSAAVYKLARGPNSNFYAWKCDTSTSSVHITQV